MAITEAQIERAKQFRTSAIIPCPEDGCEFLAIVPFHPIDPANKASAQIQAEQEYQQHIASHRQNLN